MLCSYDGQIKKELRHELENLLGVDNYDKYKIYIYQKNTFDRNVGQELS